VPMPPPRAPRVHAAPMETAGDLATERALLGDARAAHARGDQPEALRAVADHARRFPSGQLAEERESLWIKSLVAAGEPDAARARAAEFHRRFPRSIFLPAIDAALATIQ